MDYIEEIYESQLIEEGKLKNYAKGIDWKKYNTGIKNITSKFNTKKANLYLDILQTSLDVAGFEPTVGSFADAGNTVISVLRAAASSERDARKKHLINAGISVLSILPGGDLAKLSKAAGKAIAVKKGASAAIALQKGHKAAKAVIKGTRVIRKAGKAAQSAGRFVNFDVDPIAQEIANDVALDVIKSNEMVNLKSFDQFLNEENIKDLS